MIAIYGLQNYWTGHFPTRLDELFEMKTVHIDWDCDNYWWRRWRPYARDTYVLTEELVSATYSTIRQKYYYYANAYLADSSVSTGIT